MKSPIFAMFLGLLAPAAAFSSVDDGISLVANCTFSLDGQVYATQSGMRLLAHGATPMDHAAIQYEPSYRFYIRLEHLIQTHYPDRYIVSLERVWMDCGEYVECNYQTEVKIESGTESSFFDVERIGDRLRGPKNIALDYVLSGLGHGRRVQVSCALNY